LPGTRRKKVEGTVKKSRTRFLGCQAAVTREEGERSIWAFYEAVRNDELVRSQNNAFFERQRKKLHRQGARIPRNEAYLWYAAVTREEGERSIWAFYEAVRNESKEVLREC